MDQEDKAEWEEMYTFFKGQSWVGRKKGQQLLPYSKTENKINKLFHGEMGRYEGVTLYWDEKDKYSKCVHCGTESESFRCYCWSCGKNKYV